MMTDVDVAICRLSESGDHCVQHDQDITRCKLQRTQEWLEEFQGVVSEQALEILRLKKRVSQLELELNKTADMREAYIEAIRNEPCHHCFCSTADGKCCQCGEDEN